MKRIFILLTFIASISLQALSQKSDGKIYNLLVGTYTIPDKSQGIYVYSFNTETGEFNYKSEAGGVKNPSYLAISQDRKNVYSVGEGAEGTINAFSFNAATGQLVFINSSSAGGPGPCYVSVDAKKKFVFVGNYSGGSLTAIPINADGSLSQDIQNIQHTGSSVVKPNQEKPHVHAAVLSKDDRYLFTPDLGTDKINIYSIDYSKPKPLAPAAQPFASVAIGGGPRHFTFHPNGKYAYVIHEFTGDVTGFDYAEGKLTEKQKVSMSPPDFTGKVNAADIHVSPDGKFLYGSMRGDRNELGIYSIDKKGKLTFVGRQSTLGKIPRNFSLDPSGNFLLVGNQDSNEIVIFKRDKKTGLLTDTGKRISVGKPVCLKFVAVD
jgi:6-phosphogluconolactonase